MDRQAKVTIAGAGALGLACAVALADAGLRVTVCDPADATANASGVPTGATFFWKDLRERSPG